MARPRSLSLPGPGPTGTQGPNNTLAVLSNPSAAARELLGVAEPLIEKKLHPTLIVPRA